MDHSHDSPPHEGGIAPYLKFIAATLVVSGTALIIGSQIGSLPIIADAIGHAPSHFVAAFMAMVLESGRWLWVKRNKKGLTLVFRFIISGLMLYSAYDVAVEAWGRKDHPPEVDGVIGFCLAAVGLLGNFYQARLLKECGKERKEPCKTDEILIEDLESDTTMSYGLVLNYTARICGAPAIVEVYVSMASAARIIYLGIKVALGLHKH